MELSSLIQYTKTLTILYIEDDLESRVHIEAVLLSLFSKVQTATNGQDALQRYNQYNQEYNTYYDLILSDIEMPYLNGIELSKCILDINPKQHIIIISAFNEKENLQSLLNLRVDNFIHKPINFNNFFEIIEKSSKLILEQKKILNDLKYIKKKNYNLETLIDVINQVALVSKVDLEGYITETNEMLTTISGYNNEELIGEEFKKLIHADMPTIIFTHIQEDVLKGKVWKGKLKCITKSSTPFYVNTNILPIYDNQGCVQEYISISFLTTEEDIKQREFRRKVIIQYQESKRKDFNSRLKIQEMEEKLKNMQTLEDKVKKLYELEDQLKKCSNYEVLEYALQQERIKHLQCKKQLSSIETQYKHLKKECNNTYVAPKSSVKKDSS